MSTYCPRREAALTLPVRLLSRLVGRQGDVRVAESAESADVRAAAERLLAQETRVRTMAGKMLADDALLVARAYLGDVQKGERT